MEKNVITASEAKTNFFELIQRAQAGESFFITVDGHEAARLAPLSDRASLKERAALFARIDNARKGTRLNLPGQEKLTIRQLIEEGRK